MQTKFLNYEELIEKIKFIRNKSDNLKGEDRVIFDFNSKKYLEKYCDEIRNFDNLKLNLKNLMNAIINEDDIFKQIME